jgi:hypothetical protein
MGQVIELRVSRLEQAAQPTNDLSGCSDEELTARLMELEQQTLDDPNATPAQKERALKTLHFPWGKRRKEWSEAEKEFFGEMSDHAFGRRRWDPRAGGSLHPSLARRRGDPGVSLTVALADGRLWAKVDNVKERSFDNVVVLPPA